MRVSEEVLNDIKRVSRDMGRIEHTAGLLRKQLGQLLAEARAHPAMTLEEGRRAPEKEIPRETANRLIREAGTTVSK